MKTLLSTHLHNIKKGQAEKLKEKMLIGSRFSGLRRTQHSLPGFMKQALTQCLPWRQACKHSGQSH